MQILTSFTLVIFLGLSFVSTTEAVPSMAMGYTPKYNKDYKHFNYVNPDAKKGGQLSLSGFGTFDSFNPFVLKGIVADGVNILMFESLTEKSLDEPFSVYGLLADDIQLAADKLSVTYRVNKKARFSDGSEVTAEDVKYSVDQLLSDKAHPQYRFYYADIKEISVLDKYRVRFNFKKINPELHLIIGDLPVFSKKWVGDTSFDKLTEAMPLTTGPYLLESYDLGKTVVYKRNPGYWAKDLAVRKGMYNYDKIIYKYYKDQTVALEAFKAGEFDFFAENHSKRWARDHNGPKYESGEIIKQTLTHKNNAGMQGFILNTRRELFKDKRVRRAITNAMDFEWSNSHLFYNQYTRCESFFSNSELAATGLPEGDELKLLNQFKDRLPAELFTTEWSAPTTKKPSSLRNNLRTAKHLLEQAGWTVKEGKLTNAKGQVFSFEVLLIQKGFERIIAPFARNLKRLGIEVTYRTVDASLYQRRVDGFDFDMVVSSFPASQSPGNELFSMFYSEAADKKGSRNLPGINDPVVDALIEKIVSSENRKDLVTATQALDRVLLFGEYMVPNWYINIHRVAYRNQFGIPNNLPLYYDPESWMIKSWWLK
ncbi:MAG: extracellular solute-binding protein [Gammaproteobacteria bacterium]|nr:extracellular solute-binding protein [Gammaproteobacteria bacterium]